MTARAIVAFLLAPLVLLGAIWSTPALTIAVELSRIEASHGDHDRAAISASHARISEARTFRRASSDGDVALSLPLAPSARTIVLATASIASFASWKQALSPSRARARLMVFLN